MSDEPELRISIKGATAEEIEPGLSAARQVFEAAGVTAWEAAAAYERRDLLDDAGVFALADAVFRLKERGADAAEVAAAEGELASLQSHPALQDLTEREDEIADYWRVADLAAVEACCAGWASMPDTAELAVPPPAEDDPESSEPVPMTLH